MVELACRKPKELGYPHEQWTTDLLAGHIRQHAEAAGFPSLQRAGKSLVHDILAQQHLHPHRMRYYLHRRDPDFEHKKAMVLLVYHEVAMRQQRQPSGEAVPQTVTICVDEKPGCQALRNVAPDLPPRPGQPPSLARDYEYVRLGTLSLLTGLTLLTGHVHGLVRPRHRSAQFVELLQEIDRFYPAGWKLRIVCDNHSAHICKETKRYLGQQPGRFEFIFTPAHASWLNLVEDLFSKMSCSVLRGIRVDSKAEFAERVRQYGDSLNAQPVVFHWKYGLEATDDLRLRT